MLGSEVLPGPGLAASPGLFRMGMVVEEGRDSATEAASVTMMVFPVCCSGMWIATGFSAGPLLPSRVTIEAAPVLTTDTGIVCLARTGPGPILDCWGMT